MGVLLFKLFPDSACARRAEASNFAIFAIRSSDLSLIFFIGFICTRNILLPAVVIRLLKAHNVCADRSCNSNARPVR